MTDYTSKELSEIRERLEHDAALILGKLLFAYSRLDMSIGLLLAWTDEGKKLEELTDKVSAYTLHKKLSFLEQKLDAKYDKTSKAYSDYASWLKEAHAIRTIRNNLVHGRWGVEPKKLKVVNVVGLPTSNQQKSTLYSIDELKNILEGINSLCERLHSLRESSPL